MFFHNLKYSIKTLLKNKTLIFWTFAFPLILATFFNMAFSNISDSEKLDIINIAIVNDENFDNNEIFKNTFITLSDKDNDERLFETTYTNEENAKELLESNKIVGYLKIQDNKSYIICNTSGIDQTVFKYVVEEIEQNNNIINNLTQEQINRELASGNYNLDYESIINNVNKMLEDNNSNIKDISNNNLDYENVEFYTLIAMTCMYGGILATVCINKNLPNMGNIGKRISISPTKKITTIISSLIASYVVQLLGLALLFIYTTLILHIDYGSNYKLVVLLACVGTLAGMSLGTVLSTTIKYSENTKTGILIAITMFGCFLSGMFGITMKYIIDKNIPIINKINPVNMITDALYSLYYYDTLNRYYFNIISLLVFSFITLTISFIVLRRQKYDSI